MARKRDSELDDSDYWQASSSKRNRKALKQEPHVHTVSVRKAPRSEPSNSSSSRSKTAPSRVTPEQIIAHAVAIKKKKQQQTLIDQRSIASVHDEYEDELDPLFKEEDAGGSRQHRAAGNAAVKEEEVVVYSDAYEDEVEDEDEDGVEEEDQDEEEEEVAAPVVFQCGTCRSIFGDSYSFVGSNAELLLVTLSAVTNITVASEPQTSKDGMDMGSSFQELLCSQCQTVLGRKYLTTPVPLDAIRGLYSFATTTIASYQLGYPQLQLHATDKGDRPATAGDADAMKRATIARDRRELRKLREDMTKVQSLLLVVDERLHQLEETEELDSEAEQQQQERRR